MIRLNGEKLKQYDLNRTIEIIPRGSDAVRDVVFYKGREPYQMAFRTEDGKIVADVPNVLLKWHGNLTCIVDYVDETGTTIREHQNFFVHKNAMPDGYEYEESEEVRAGGGNSEEWTFTLEDGSTVTKNVVVKA